MARPSTPEVLQALRGQGFRETRPRRAVVEAALRRGRFTAPEIVGDLRPAGIGRATVFRTLEVLIELGILEQLHTDEHHAYTVCSPRHHHHLVCRSCANLVEITSPAVERAVEEIARAAGYQLQGHLLEVFGLCPQCRPGP